jgi:hypothetical protein
LVSGGAERIQHGDTIGPDVRGLRQGLNQDLMVLGLARSRPLAICQHREQCSLHDRSIGCIEPRIGTEPFHASIRQRALRRSQQPGNLDLIGDVWFELSDAKQVV